MKRVHGLLIIGGASRNVGKTTFTCKVIRRFASDYPIIGLKIKTVYDGDSFFHGKDNNPLTSEFRLIEEFSKESDEDTGKMLKAGAKRVFKLKVKSESIHKAFNELKNQLLENILIICESNSLRKVIEPDLFLLIKPENGENMKSSAKEVEELADKIIFTDGKIHNFHENRINIDNNKWVLNS